MDSPTRVRKKTRPADGKENRSAAEQYFRHSRLKGRLRRHTYYARVDLLEKIREYADREQIGISESINRILEGFFEEREVKPKSRRR